VTKSDTQIFVGEIFTDIRHHQTDHDMSLIEDLAIELWVHGYSVNMRPRTGRTCCSYAV